MNVKEAIESRRAYRALETASLDSEAVEELGKAAQLAPSCFNKQPWRFVFISGSQRLEEFHSVLSEQNSWAKNAPLIIAVITEPSLDCRLKDGREYSFFDTGIASGFIMLRATELGLVAHPMAGYNQAEAKAVLGIPEEMTLISLIAVGVHAENYEELLESDSLKAEAERPVRKDLSEFISADQYQAP